MTTETITAEMAVPLTVYLVNGTILQTEPISGDVLASFYEVLGAKDGRVKFPCTDGNMYLLAADRINYITFTPIQESN